MRVTTQNGQDRLTRVVDVKTDLGAMYLNPLKNSAAAGLQGLSIPLEPNR